jgi:GNAT superfamily N-acetyltransferase
MTTLELISGTDIAEVEAELAEVGEKLDGSSFDLAVTIDPFDLEPDGEPSASVMYFMGHIQLIDPNTGEARGMVGQVEFAIADLREEGPAWVLDGDADDYAFNILFDDEGSLKKEARRALGAQGDSVEVEQLLILHRLKILPEARGRKLGAMVVSRIINKFGVGCDLIAMVCRPLQLNGHRDAGEFGRRMALETLPTDEATATQKLTRYYRSMGFRAVKGSRGVLVKLP